ncbi:MAG TPA: hypothetical protein PLN60_10305 [Bacillota bacterium]|nr:hypothetical protein [Bacillota bacterium]
MLQKGGKKPEWGVNQNQNVNIQSAGQKMANAAKNLSSSAMEKRKRKLAATPKKTSSGLNISGKNRQPLW